MPRINEGGSDSSNNTKPGPVQGTKTKTLGGGGDASDTNEGYGPGPVSVYVAPDVYKPAVSQAVKLWNRQAGFTVFTLVTKPNLADVTVSLGNTLAKDAAGLGVPGAWTKSGRGHVILDKSSFSKEAATSPDLHDAAGFVAQLAGTVQHELGHSIGLGHPGGPDNPYGFTPETGIGTRTSGIMGSAQYSHLDAGGVPTSTTQGLSTQSERDQVTQLRTMGEDAFFARYREARNLSGEQAPLAADQDTAGLTEDQWRQVGGWAGGSSGGSDSGGSSSGGSSSGGSSSGGSSSSSGGSSSSSGSSEPKTDTYGDVFKGDAVARQKWSLFAQAYSTLWGEPATEKYLIEAVNQGWNTAEFIHHERMKTAFQQTKTYKDEAKGLYGILRQLGI